MKPSSVTPSDPWRWAVPACVAFVLWGCTILLCDVADAKPGERWPSWVDRILAVPIKLTDISDLRYYALPLGWAMALAMIAIQRQGVGLAPKRSIRQWWFEVLAAATVGWACVSAWRNDSWMSSRGWIFWLLCGVGWAATLGRWCTPRQVSRAVAAGSAIAFLASFMSLAHRQILGERFFQLPVGPVTLTASLGALWASIATVWLTGALTRKEFALPIRTSGGKKATANSAGVPDPQDLTNPSSAALTWCAIVAVFAMILLWAAGRRGATLGLLAAWAVVGGFVGWHRYHTRGRRALMIAGALAALIAVGWYVRGQAQSTVETTSLPLKVRSIYWETMLKRIPDSPIWGFGPDQFVMIATTALAHRRSEEPRVLHGIVDFDGHNEWLQETFELGIPGALLYVSLPIGVFILAARRWRHAEGARRVWLLALMAGLVELCVSELSSINLRHPILQGWYWTLLGLTLALGRKDDAAGKAPDGPNPRFGTARIARRAVCGVAALAVMAVVGMDLRAALHHARGRALLNHDDARATSELEMATGRFGVSRWLSTRNYLGNSISSRLRLEFNAAANGSASSRPASAMAESDALRRRAIEVWSELYRACPGYLDNGFRFAEAQVMAGDRADAKRTLQRCLQELEPYDRNLNVLLIQIGELDPASKLECVRRTLRQEMWEPVLLSAATDALRDSVVAASWPQRVEQALSDVARTSDTDWRDPLAPETLRIETLRLLDVGDRAGADRAERAAALAYDRLARSHSSVRRKWPAEADAWFWSAKLLFDLDPAKYEEVFSRIERAEFFAADGLPTNAVPNAKPAAELIGGRVIPMELPEKLSPLWRFSAMMHMAMKKEEGQISLRITWSLPENQRSSSQTFAELGRLAMELVKVYQSQPASSRPPSYPELIRLANQFAPHQQL